MLQTRLGRSVAPLAAAHPGTSGICPLANAADAFAARYLLASAAERTLDVQYYIWRNDLSGTLLMKALVDAADRGVHVRLLLDDNNTSGLDAALAALDAHPRIQVRLFNPFAVRTSRTIGYLTDFPRLNRRMHNKSFTADNEVTIIGGRNVGDEYFGATDGMLFTDLDVMAIGPVVRDVSDDFERYWSSDSAVPAGRLLPAATGGSIAAISADAARVERNSHAVRYMNVLQESSFVRELVAGTLPFEWAATRMISDPPGKVVGRAHRGELLFARFQELFGSATAEIDLVSPYFVPTAHGVALFSEISRRGVRVRVLTNALEATDVAIVHAGYAKRRAALLRGGVAIWEMRRKPGLPEARDRSAFRSSAASLHAKTFAIDRSRLFVGSFNFDPRSAELNTEMGFVIESAALASQLAEAFDEPIPLNAYEVRLGKTDGLRWVGRTASGITESTTEPGTGFWQRLAVSLMARLPIEPLL